MFIYSFLANYKSTWKSAGVLKGDGTFREDVGSSTVPAALSASRYTKLGSITKLS